MGKRGRLALAESLTPTQALDRFEYKWRDRLGTVNLVGEYEVSPSVATTMLRAVGLVARRPTGLAKLRNYPACVAVSMATFASAHYRGGELWPAIFRHIGFEGSSETRATMGTAFLTALEKLELPTINDGTAYLGPISFHAVIPDYCLRDVLVLLQQRQELNPALDGQSFITWAEGHPTRLAHVDKPAARFLLRGGEFAVDLVDRLLDLLDALRSGITDIEDLVASSGAPKRLVKKAVELTADGALELLKPARTGSRTARSTSLEGPHLLLDVDRASVVLRLPQLAGLNDDPVRWNVLLDGVVTPTHPGTTSTGTGGTAFEEAVVARPVRAISAVFGASQGFELELVRSEAPLLAFDQSGHLLPGSAPLPGEEVWLLYPETKGRPTSGGRALQPSVSLMGPIGWGGWALDRVPLDSVRNVEFDGQVRAIHHRGRPGVEAAEPLPGLLTRSGVHVVAERPTATLPRLGSETSWHVEVRDAATGQVIASDDWTCAPRCPDEEPVASADPFDGRSQPIVGEFDILVRGPLGTRTSRRVAVAEGLTQRTSVHCRSFTPTGLTPVTVDWGSTTGLSVEPVRKEFRPDELRMPLTVRAGQASLSLVCEPNHLEICRVVDGEATEWSAAVLTVPSDRRGDLGILEVRMATGQALPPLTLIGESGLRQVLPPSGGAGSRQRFDLARIADTVRREKVARLQWTVGDEETVLVSFRPDRLCSGAVVEDDVLRLTDFAGVPDAVAGVYQLMAPWRRPELISIDEQGEARLPEELVVAGPLLVLVRLEDPWAPAPWPAWPHTGAAVEREGWPEPTSDAEASAIHYLAGLTRVPSDPAAYPYLWAAWERSNEISRHVAPRALAEDIRNQFSLDHEGAIESLRETGLSSSTALVMAMGGGLLSARPELTPSSLPVVWRRFPALAATADVQTVALPWDEITAVCGGLVEEVAAGSDGWAPDLGRFLYAPILNAKTPKELEDMWREARVVPAGLLDGDTRAAAAMSLFRVRGKASLKGLCRSGPALLEAGEKLLLDAGMTQSVGWLRARGNKDRSWDWEILPQVSAALAAMARLAARGDDRATRVTDQFTSQWQALAREVPELVEIDIVIAEMLARAATDPYTRPARDLEENE